MRMGESRGASPFGEGLGVFPSYILLLFLDTTAQGDGRKGFSSNLLMAFDLQQPADGLLLDLLKKVDAFVS